MKTINFDSLHQDDRSVLSKYINKELASATSQEWFSYPHGMDSSRSIEIVLAKNTPMKGTHTWCSLGLSELSFTDKGFPDRNELVGALKSEEIDFGMVLGTVAHGIADLGLFARPGVVLEDAIGMCDLGLISNTMPHALLLFPYLWNRGMVGTELSNFKVWMLQVVPIYNKEFSFIKEHSFEEFDQLLEAKSVRLIEPDRPCCVS